MFGVPDFKFIAPNVASKMTLSYVPLQTINRKHHFATVVPINSSKIELPVRAAFHVGC